jgi:acylaminoacyl-peptidase
MSISQRFGLSLVAVAVAVQPLGAQQKHPITFDDFAAVRAVSDPQISPDGRSVLYAVRTTDVAARRGATDACRGRRSTRLPGDDVSARARWSPGGGTSRTSPGAALDRRRRRAANAFS